MKGNKNGETKIVTIIAVALAAMIGIGSFAVVTTTIDESSTLSTSSTSTTVPQSTSKSISPLPVTFTPDTDANVVESGGTTGSSIATRQKVVVNLVLDVSEDAQVALHLQNTSEDRQIFLFRASAPPQVILDMEAVDSCATVHGITGNNEWLASIAGDSTACKFSMEVSHTDAGVGVIVVQLLRVG